MNANVFHAPTQSQAQTINVTNVMPAKSLRQQKAASRELVRRTIFGYKKQRKNEKQKRAFGTATLEQLKEFSERQ